jgi:hypothetical protein
MRRTLLGLLLLVAVGAVAFAAWAIFSDLPPPQRQVELPIEAQ